MHPGVIETPMVTQGDAVEQIKEFAKSIPMRRMAQSEEVTNMVLFWLLMNQATQQDQNLLSTAA